MEIIITGASGFVGVNLSKYLMGHNHKIHKVSLRNTDTVNALGSNAQAIIHLAGKAHDLKKTSNDAEYYEVNFELTKRLYDHFLQSSAQKFIYISSVKAAADVVEGVLDENVVPNPVTAYGKSKLMAEEYILQNLPNDKAVYILRPCMIHGPGNKGNLNLLYSIVSKGIPYPLGAFDNKRSYLSVENLCFVIKELLEQSTISNGIYNVADDVSLSTTDVIELISDSQSKTAITIALPRGIIKTIAKIGDVLPLPLNSERLQKLTENYVISNAKIVAAMQKKMPISAKEGLLKTFQSFQKC